MIFLNFRCSFVTLLACFLFAGCSTVKSSYISDGYTDNPLGMIKHVKVIINVPEDKENIAPLIAEISADMLKLRTNYFIDKTKITTSQWNEDCKGTGGIILFTVEKHNVISQSRIELEINCELYDCNTKKLLWKAIGSAKEKSDNASLAELTDIYEKKYPEATALFASPVFVIIQDFVDIIPNPELTDAEIDLKIKLESQKSSR